MDGVDDRTRRALHRFEVISAYLAEELPRGKRKARLDQLAGRNWFTPEGTAIQYSSETLRAWVRRYRAGGLEALLDAERDSPGPKALEASLIEAACRLKQEVPERSIERVIRILEDLGIAQAGTVRRSTLHRALKAKGLSARRLSPPRDKDLDRWQADYANDLWQADMLTGPWLPDPDQPDKVRRAYLYAFLDDASRLLLHGRFSFKGDLPALEIVLRRAVQRWGRPRRVYYDNGMVFRSHHMRQICAELGIHRPIHTQPRRPMGHGKIEAFNHFCTNAFIAEVKASSIRTLAELNEAFLAWIDEHYNNRPHAELDATPLERWRRDMDQIQWADQDKIRTAFLWREERTADACGVLRLFTVAYQASHPLARRRIEVRYDPDFLDEIEIWHQGRFFERVRPLEISTHRRARPQADPPPQDQTTPKSDWLGLLVRRRRANLSAQSADPEPRLRALDDRMRHEALLDSLRRRLHPSILDDVAVVDFDRRFGPLDPQRAGAVLDSLLAHEPNDRHLGFYLDAILRAHRSEEDLS